MRVALADDSTLFRHGLALLLETSEVEVVLQTRTGEELLARMPTPPPDAVILDIRMPPTFTDEGLVTADLVRQRWPNVGILVLSTYAETPYAIRLLRGGARGVGYLLKDRVDDVRNLRDALARIVAGESVVDPDIVSRLVAHRSTGPISDLTERERDVLRLMAEGRSNIGIGRVMYLSPKTIEAHAASVFAKLGVSGDSDDNRRVLAVLTWLRSQAEGGGYHRQES
jgi:DNA-binding NarL/FixJ family response regulator